MSGTELPLATMDSDSEEKKFRPDDSEPDDTEPGDTGEPDSGDDHQGRKVRSPRAPRMPDHLTGAGHWDEGRESDGSPLDGGSKASESTDRPRQYSDYDPLDADARKPRKSNLPRMVDITQPLPQTQPGAAVPRPHQVQKKLRPEDIVPGSDNPMVFWQMLGLSLLSDKLWPQKASSNPVMVYYTGRQRGRMTEDLFGMIPWILFIFLDIFCYLFFFQNPIEYVIYNSVKIPFLLIFCSIYTAGMLSVHIRKTMTVLPLNEMLLTRLSMPEISQGIAIRPLAVQAFCAGFMFMFQFLFCFILFAQGFFNSISVLPAIFLSLFTYQMAIIATEMGGATGLRAHLCIRSGAIAMMKAFLDLGILFLVFFITVAVLSVLSLIFVGVGLMFAIVSPVIPIVFIVTAALVIGTIIRNFLADEASEAIQWSYLNPREWWVFEEQGSIEGIERGLWTPWKAQATERKIKLAIAQKDDDSL